MLCATFFGQHFADKVLEENFAWIKIQWKLFLANFVECRIKFATQFVKEENILAFSAKSCLIAMNISKIILKFADVTSSILFGQECIPAACPVKLGVFWPPEQNIWPGPGQCGGQTAFYPELPGSSYGGRKRAQTHILAPDGYFMSGRKMIPI